MKTADIPEPIRAFIEATNAGDTDHFVAAFTDDASLDDWGREFHGPDGVRSWDRTDNIGVQSRLEALAVERGDDADTYVVAMRVRGNGFNGTGTMTFGLRGGRIVSLRIT
jgi:ketosteroid isomerase-like protein